MMPASHTNHSRNSDNKPPFTVDTIKQYGPFMALDLALQAKICELLANKEVNKKGKIKRPLSGYLLYIQEKSLTIANQCSSNETGHSVQTKAALARGWHDLKEEKIKYKLLARQARRARQEEFPGYKHSPVDDRKWKGINEEGRKKWFLESLVSAITKALNPGAGSPYLDINQWICDPSNHKYVSPQILSEALGGPQTMHEYGFRIRSETTVCPQQLVLTPNSRPLSAMATPAPSPNLIFLSSSERFPDFVDEINEIWRDNDDTKGDRLYPDPARVYKIYMTSGYEAMMDYITSFRPSTQDESEPSYDYTELIHEYMNPIAYEDDNEFGDEDDTVPLNSF
ncbi:hypothetical protein RHS03_01318, partial [Rhizoctonia solani]